MYRLALRILFADHTRYFMLVSGTAFCTLLVIQQSSVFCGIMSWTYAVLRNSRAPIWVMDPKVEQANDPRAMRDVELDAVRSVPGVAWAQPLFFSGSQARLADGSFKMVQLIGIDSVTFAGAPVDLVEGRLQDLRLPDTILIDQFGQERLSFGYTDEAGHPRKLRLGDSIELNNHQVRIVGICRVSRPIAGGPYIFTTYHRAIEFARPSRHSLSFVLAAPQPGLDAKAVAARIGEQTGLQAQDEFTFRWRTLFWFVENTGIPAAFGTTVSLGIIVGIVITAQTFFSFVAENSRSLASFKAMGAPNQLLLRMTLFQALIASLIGYGIGLGLCAAFGYAILPRGHIPFILLPQVVVGVLFISLAISLGSALFAGMRILRLEPDSVFRS